MKVNNVFQSRPAYYDRNPTVITTLSGGSGAVAPHGTTQRASYTVPTGRKAVVVAAQLAIHRVTAPTTPALMQNDLNANSTFLHVIKTYTNVADVVDEINLASNAHLAAGNIAKIEDQDLSTGGTADFNQNVYIVEYDA